jgi:hypothetical protein
MSVTFEKFVSRFEAAAPAARSRAMDLILAETDSDPPIDVDPDEAAAKAGIDPELFARLKRAIDEANAWRAAQND